MFKGHPKGLFVAFFANMGERFGFYTMVSIFVLFMQAKYGLSAAAAGSIYATFLVGVYVFPLLGGFLADRFLGYGRTISLGLVVMFIGYVLLALPTLMNTGFPLVVVALTVIALGTGLFKGNLQALVGNLYDDPKYAPMRDRAFSIFYMGINIGAMFAPSASMAMVNGIMGRSGLVYDARIPALANDFLKGKLADASSLPGPGPRAGCRSDPGHSGRVRHPLHQHAEQVLPPRLRRRLPQPHRLDGRLLGLPQALQDGRPDRAPEGQVRGAQVAGRRAVPRADARAPDLPRPGLLRRHLLLDGLPPERRDPDLLRPRLYRPERRQGDQPLVRHDRASARLPVRPRVRLPREEGLGQAGPHPGRRLVLRLRRPGLSPLQRLQRGQRVPAPDVPALQPVLHRRPDAPRRRPLRLAQPQGQGAVRAAQDRHRHAHDGRGLRHPGRRPRSAC